MQSCVAIVNTVLPVVGGIFIDAFGTIPGALITTVLITSGNVLVALSASSKSLYMMIVGRILYGIGSGTVVIVQETILSQWFNGRSLAAVVAMMLTVSRLASFCAQATVVPIANWSGWYGYGLWVSRIISICQHWLCNNINIVFRWLVYIFNDHYLRLHWIIKNCVRYQRTMSQADGSHQT